MKRQNDMPQLVGLMATIIFVAIVFMAVMPFIQIWAVNTLFKTDIEYSWLNWFAAVLLNTSIRSVNYTRT